MSLQAKFATAGDANATQSARAAEQSEEQSEKLAELAKDRDAIQTALDEATAQVRKPLGHEKNKAALV